MNNTTTQKRRVYSKQNAKRRAQVRKQKRMIVMVFCMAIFSFVLLGTTISAKANTKNDVPEYTYYKTIEIQDGDSLWSIASVYAPQNHQDTRSYIKEVCSLNHISENQMLHEGATITLPYQSTELH